MLLTCIVGAWAQSGLGNVPKTVDWRNAHITDVGVVASDVMLWKMQNSDTHKLDTLVTSESYILWQSEGDLEEQAEERRANSDDVVSNHTAKAKAHINGLRDVKPIAQEGRLQDWLAFFEYYVFLFEYPSVDANGNPVILSAIAACPTKDADEVRDVVIGTHITITSDSQRPSARTKGYKEDDWGVLMSLAGGKKMKLGWRANLTFGILLPFWPFWAGVGIAAEVKSGDDAFNNNLVILADYEGYGVTKDRAHPYLYQELTARQVVDATRYGIALYKNDPGLADIRHPIRSDFRSISCGYSQGGSVAMATHRFIEQNGLVDELHFAGSLCGDGPYDPIATLMYYMKNDLADKKMSMPVVLPLIVKGMLDTNPYMKGHKVTDYFQPEFLASGIMQWLTDKVKSTDDITDAWKKTGGIFDKNGCVMMRDVMTPECYAYFKKLYEDNKDTFTSANGVPLPTKRGVFEDLHFALASNDMTTGWTPQHAILLYHSSDDTVVPYENATSAVNRLGGWTTLLTSKDGLDHVPAGTDFFKGKNSTIISNFGIRAYVAKRQLCELQWNNQKKGAISEFE